MLFYFLLYKLIISTILGFEVKAPIPNLNTTLMFGSEGGGLTIEAIEAADDVREIESFGSTRSVNVGVAAGIAMYEWVRQCVLSQK